MPRSKSLAVCLCLGSLSAAVIGCSPSGDAGVSKPSVNAASAAQAAMELYDADGDGTLSEDELAECPAILNFKAEYDPDGNGVTLQELESRLNQLFGPDAPGLVSVYCTVESRGKPVEGAEVRFVPEPFLGDSIPTAVGKTNLHGQADIAIPDDQLPASDRGLGALRVGLYKVEIEHPSIKNNDKKFGWEVGGIARGAGSPHFDVSAD